jgi:predicted cupin superfamily sugar epimerase
VWFGSFPTLDVESSASDGSHLVNSRKRDPEKHYSLVGCTCAPGFEYEDFEMATFDDVKAIAPKAEPFLSYLIPSTK